MNRWWPLVILYLLCVLSPDTSHARKSTPIADDTPVVAAPRASNAAPGRGVNGAGVLQQWTFDNPDGTPNAQGWTTVDLTAQPALFSIVNAPVMTGFSGHALWCGVTSSNCGSMDACGYASLPGYGNNWQQRWQSQSFTVNTSGVTVNFQLAYDMEPSYDFLYLEYTTGGNVWNLLGTWTGTGNVAVSKSIAAGTYTSPIRIRLRFESDGGFSDEDGSYPTNGPVFIDNLQVINNGTTIDTHNFTAEALGATGTTDGHWFGIGSQAFGNHAALFDGDAVVQQDPLLLDSTNLWGFFSASSENYACGGFPAQAVIPHGSVAGGLESYMNNVIRSPMIALTGVGATEAIMLTFDAYMDLPQDNLIYYTYRVRSKVGGVWQGWKPSGVVYYDASKTWSTRTHNLRPLIPSTATDIQIDLGAIDMCPAWCGLYGSGTCHSHGPLFDNISVSGTNTPVGTTVQVSPVDQTTGTTPVLVQFGSVTQPGTTSLVTGPTGPAVPGSFQVGNGTYYNISTTATVSGNIGICFQYDEATLTVPEASLRVLHWDTTLNPDAWVDVTSAVDTGLNRVYAVTDHLSPFVFGAGSVTAVGDTPARPALHQNVPNPFNPTTTITYDVPAAGSKISLKIYDATGRLVRTLVDERKSAGSHDVTWDGRDGFGAPVASGVYFYKMIAGAFVETRRMVLLK